MEYNYYTKEEYPDDYIKDISLNTRKGSVEKEFYRHGAFFIKCFIMGESLEPSLVEWYERLREIGSIKFSFRKQVLAFIKHLLRG